MRLENKMHKWLKLFLKLLPFLFIFYNLVAFIGSDLVPSFSLNLNDDVVENTMGWINSFFTLTYYSYLNVYEFFCVPQFLYDFNDIVFNLFVDSWFAPNGVEILQVVLLSFEWFLMVDFIDLIFSAFRFIIDICRSWLDSFYDKNKGGYK